MQSRRQLGRREQETLLHGFQGRTRPMTGSTRSSLTMGVHGVSLPVAEGTVRLITVVKLETRTDKVPTLAGKRL